MDKQSHQIRCNTIYVPLGCSRYPKTWEAVPGRYQREFVQQCSADIDWNVTSSIKQEYEQDREAARQGKQGQAFYNKVVLQQIKSQKL